MRMTSRWSWPYGHQFRGCSWPVPCFWRNKWTHNIYEYCSAKSPRAAYGMTFCSLESPPGPQKARSQEACDEVRTSLIFTRCLTCIASGGLGRLMMPSVFPGLCSDCCRDALLSVTSPWD